MLTALVLSNHWVAAQVNHPANKSEIMVVCGKFMEMLKNEKYSEAFDLLKPFSIIYNAQLDTLAKTTSDQMKSAITAYGKVDSFELVSSKDIKGIVIQLVYLLQFQRSPLKFIFYLYNNGSGWTIIHIKYNEDYEGLFSDASQEP